MVSDVAPNRLMVGTVVMPAAALVRYTRRAAQPESQGLGGPWWGAVVVVSGWGYGLQGSIRALVKGIGRHRSSC